MNLTEDKLKSYWNRPGGKFGTIAALIGLGIGGWYLLPILTTIVWNTVNFVLACGVAFALLYVFVINPRLRQMLGYGYEMLMKAILGFFIKLDPFLIAEDMIVDMRKDRVKLFQKTVEVEGQKKAIEQKIAERENQKDQQRNLAKAAQGQGNTMVMTNATRQLKRLDEFITQLTPIKNDLGRVYDHLLKVYKRSEAVIEDAENELSIKKDLYQSVTKGRNALSQALRFFEGDPEKKLLAQQSMEYLKEDIGGKLAEMKLAMSITDDFVQKIDLENATYEQQGLQMLDELAGEQPKTSVKYSSLLD